MRSIDDVIRGLETKSDKIRALGKEGYSPGDISRALNIRYQFAYNVLAASSLVGASRNELEGETETVEEALEQTFALEADLQQALRQNIQQLELGLNITDEGR